MTRYSRREFLAYGSVATGGLLVLGACSGSGDGGGESGGSGGFGSELPDIEGAELITDPSEFPTRFSERPQFTQMVADGLLPPVEERIGQDPLVLRPIDGIGTYGGTIRRGFIGPDDNQNAANFCAGPDTLLYWDPRGDTVVPNLARDFELSDDFTELVLHLRRGMRWSDGEPFTADDILFWYNDMNLNRDVSSGARALRVDGQNVVIERVDDYTVRYLSPVPHPLLPGFLAGADVGVGGQSSRGSRGLGGFAPRHYLEQFHPAYVSQDEADRIAAGEGFEGWVPFFSNRNSWFLNPELPTLTPWVVTQPMNDPPWEFFANPYSVWVDTEGNQLPYIDEITMSGAESREVLVLRALSGEFDVQERHLEVAQLPELLDNQERSDYTIHRNPQETLDFAIGINLAYDADPVLGDLLRTVEFRRALSLAIDRDQVNEAFFVGTSVPTAIMASDTSIYFPGEEWRTRWATLDVEQANELLDGIGLTERDGSGFRQRPDGGGRIRLDYQTTGGFADRVGIGELIKEHWTEIGIDMTVQGVDDTLIVQRVLANAVMLLGNFGGTDDPFLASGSFLPTETSGVQGLIGVPYVSWFASGGREGTEPPPSLDALKEAMDLYSQGLRASEEERVELGKELYMLHADNVLAIGVVGFGVSFNGIQLVSNRLANVPARIRNSYGLRRSPNNAFPVTFYYS